MNGDIHPDDVAFSLELDAIAFTLSEEYGLDLRILENKRRPYQYSAYGHFYLSDRRISITLRYKVRAYQARISGIKWYPEPLDEFQVLDTLAHELAHARYFDHSKRHKAFTAELEPLVRGMWVAMQRKEAS